MTLKTISASTRIDSGKNLRPTQLEAMLSTVVG